MKLRVEILVVLLISPPSLLSSNSLVLLQPSEHTLPYGTYCSTYMSGSITVQRVYISAYSLQQAPEGENAIRLVSNRVEFKFITIET
jgi:hypothetical protein